MQDLEKKTLGTQIIENWGKQDAPECREVTNSCWWKTLQPRLKATIEKHRNYAPKIYILVNMRNSGLLGHNVKHFTFLVAHEEFPPKASAMLIKYDYKSEKDDLLWVLPDEKSIDEILDLPETYDKKLVADCAKYRETQKVSILI